MSEYLQLFFSLAGVLGLIFVLFYYLKKFNGRFTATGGKKLRIIDKMVFGRDVVIAVVCVCDKLMLVGIAPHGISKLCDLEITESEYLAQSKTQDCSFNFGDVLSNIVGRSSNKKTNFVTDETAGDSENSEGEKPLETNNITSDETE